MADYKDGLLEAYAAFYGSSISVLQMLRDAYIDAQDAVRMLQEAAMKLEAERARIFPKREVSA